MTVRLSGKWLQRRPSQAAGVGQEGQEGPAAQTLRRDADPDGDLERASQGHGGLRQGRQGLPQEEAHHRGQLAGGTADHGAADVHPDRGREHGDGGSAGGVGDDGNAKQRREDALLEFESLFETSFEQTTAGKKHTSWEQARGSEAAPNTLAPPPQAEVAVVVVAAEQFGVRGEESEREEGAAAAAPAALDRGWPVSFKFKLEVAETLRRGSIAK
eukprot:2568905-Rhodomonas_salina.2